MAVYQVRVSDVGLAVVPGLRLFVQPERPTYALGRVLTTGRREVHLNAEGAGAVELVPTIDTNPRTMYSLIAQFSNGREMDVLQFVAQPGGGVIRHPDNVPALPGQIMFGYGPFEPPRGVLYLDLAAPGDKVNIHGEPGAVV